MNAGGVDAIEGTMDGIMYTLWGMKDPHYVMRMMATGGPLTVTLEWKKNTGSKILLSPSNIRAPTIGTFATATPSMTTTIYATLCPCWRIPG